MAKLGDELTEVIRKKKERAARLEQDRLRREEEKTRREGKALANEMIRGLPARLREEASKGSTSLQVLVGSNGGRFTKAESRAAYLISDWARGENLDYWYSTYKYNPDWMPDADALWLKWGGDNG